MRQGLVHLYTGEGKGKTTAAVGLSVRCLGTGGKVLFVQFLKGCPSGECALLQQLGARLIRAQTSAKFTNQMTPDELAELAGQNLQTLEQAREVLQDYQLLVLDEAIGALGCGLLPLESLLELVEQRPPHLEVVLTGRGPPEELTQLADYHTEFACKRHPFEKGISARKGVEF